MCTLTTMMSSLTVSPIPQTPALTVRRVLCCRANIPPFDMDSTGVHTYTQLLHKLRLVKSPAELNLMRKAGQIAASAFREVWFGTLGLGALH